MYVVFKSVDIIFLLSKCLYFGNTSHQTINGFHSSRRGVIFSPRVHCSLSGSYIMWLYWRSKILTYSLVKLSKVWPNPKNIATKLISIENKDTYMCKFYVKNIHFLNLRKIVFWGVFGTSSANYIFVYFWYVVKTVLYMYYNLKK